MEGSRMPMRVMREKIYTRRKRDRPKVRWGSRGPTRDGDWRMEKKSSG
jgi:hypothetical protein